MKHLAKIVYCFGLMLVFSFFSLVGLLPAGCEISSPGIVGPVPESDENDGDSASVTENDSDPSTETVADSQTGDDTDTEGDADSEITTDWEELEPLADGVWIRVRNQCPFPIWIRAAGGNPSVTLQPNNGEIATGATRNYESPKSWPAARVTAYKDDSLDPASELEKAEITVSQADEGANLNYNITYVDWVGLPMKMAGFGGTCSIEHEVSCMVSHADLLSGCPDHLLEGDRCRSAGNFCSSPSNESHPYCHALDDEILRCAEEGPLGEPDNCREICKDNTTPNAYACRGRAGGNADPGFNASAMCCAALNRGMLDNPNSDDASLFYTQEPFNTYAKWVHGKCPGIYAFPYDDWQAQGGFRACRGTELRITFCPAGVSATPVPRHPMVRAPSVRTEASSLRLRPDTRTMRRSPAAPGMAKTAPGHNAARQSRQHRCGSSSVSTQPPRMSSPRLAAAASDSVGRP